MQKCRYCGADLPENTRFCGKCGSVQDILAADVQATRNNTLKSQSWTPEDGTIPATWPPYSNDPTRGSAPAWSPLYGATPGGNVLLSGGQVSLPGAPVVQGTPQIGSIPSVAGSPTPFTNAPASNPTLGAGNGAPVSHPVQGPANAAPVSHPAHGAGNAPINHPVQGPGNPPVSHPTQGPGTM